MSRPRKLRHPPPRLRQHLLEEGSVIRTGPELPGRRDASTAMGYTDVPDSIALPAEALPPGLD